jgi:hypothetical protein
VATWRCRPRAYDTGLAGSCSTVLRYLGTVSLLVQVCAVVAAIGFLTALLRGQSPRIADLATAAVAVTIAVSAILAGSLLWPTLTRFVREAGSDARVSDAQAAAILGQSLGLRTDFLNWVAERIPSGATFYLVGGVQTLLWFNYRLTPRRAVDSPADADWVVFGGRDSMSQLGSAAARFGPEERFVPGFAIARRLDAG